MDYIEEHLNELELADQRSACRHCCHRNIGQTNVEEICRGDDASPAIYGPVRLVCMVQDMLGPEFYPNEVVFRPEDGRVESVRRESGRYRDYIACPDGFVCDETSVGWSSSCRHVFRCVSVVGQTGWNRLVGEDCCEDDGDQDEAVCPQLGEKRQLSHRRSPEKRRKIDVDVDDEPFTNFQPLSCLVKLYDVKENELKLNDIIEVVGVVSGPAVDDPMEADNQLEDSAVLRSHRLHGVHWRKVDLWSDLADRFGRSLTVEVDCGRSMVDWLADVLNDRLAAHYLLCHLLSSVRQRDDTVGVVGSFSLALSSCDLLRTSKLVQVLRLLLPRLVFVKVTADLLNSRPMVPVKNYETNCLSFGLLQLANQTQLVLHVDSKLKINQLNEQGTRNLAAIEALIKEQNVAYNFLYYSLDFPTDVRVLVLAESKCSLSVDVDVPLASANSPAQFDLVRDRLAQLDAFRSYLAQAAQIMPKIPEQVESAMQDEFISMRQRATANSGDTISGFNRLVNLSILLSRLQKLDQVGLDQWTDAVQFERERLQQSR